MSDDRPRPVPLLDLRAQYERIGTEIEAAALDVLRSGAWVLGEHVARFEEALSVFLGGPSAVGVASGSDAVLLALMALDVGPGDEVVTTPFSFFATVSSITRLGATPVFADIGAADYLIDPDAVAAVTTARTRAILPVHLYGQLADMEALDVIARRRRVPIVEDAAQAIGATRGGAGIGHSGDIATLSFYPTKNLGAVGDAGAVLTRDSRLEERLRSLRDHGSVRRYEHLEVGINSRLDAVQAAVLGVKLAHLEAWNEARRVAAARYRELFCDAGLDDRVGLPVEVPEGRHVFHQYVVRVSRRDELRAHLQGDGIGCQVFYPIPLHLQACFEPLGYREGDLPEAERAAHEVLALPMYAELTEADQARVVASVAAFFARG